MTVKELSKLCGGTSKMARALNIPISTIYNWINKNKLPAWRINDVRNFVERIDVDVPTDFWTSVSQQQNQGGK